MSAKKALANGKKLKISFDEIKEFTLSKMAEIRASDAPNGVKAQQERRLGNSVKTKITGRASRSEENRPALSYMSRIVTRIRSEVRFAGFIRHDFNDKISEIAKAYPLSEKEIDSLVDIEHKKARESIKRAVSNLKSRADRTKNSENKRQLKEAAEKLSKVKFEPVLFETLVKTSDQKEELEEMSSKRVQNYHQNQRTFDFEKMYSLMATSLNSTYDWEALGFGLALASGRRSAELACSVDGVFEPTNKPFEALFTSSVKAREEKSFKIPLLVDFDTFQDALSRFRNHHRIARLNEEFGGIENYDERHEKFNASISQQLNEYVKGVFEGPEWLAKSRAARPASPWKFKDARAIYARMAYAEYCSVSKKAGRTPIAEELFFKNKLGHEDAATQMVYKQFVIKKAEEINNRKVKQIKESVSEIQPRNRTEELATLFQTKEIQDSRAFSKYAAWVLDQVKADPSIKISSSWIKDELGGNKGIIAKFVKIVREAGLQNAF